MEESNQSKDSQNENTDRSNHAIGEQRKVPLIDKLNSLYQSVGMGGSYKPQDFHWDILKEWKNENVKYFRMKNILQYQFKAEDEKGFFQS